MNQNPTNDHNKLELPPLALYIHIPWCIRKCPYCDFNSHGVNGDLPVAEYIASLLADCQQDAHLAQGRPIQSLFFGGGTPSLLSGQAIADILCGVQQHLRFAADCEITLEANPGTAEYAKFEGYLSAGVNRLSLGAQSFSATQLQALGRIHAPDEIHRAYRLARRAGFENINLDIMFGLPQQTLPQAMNDLSRVIDLQPEHISWYQLTIETNTAFYNKPPPLPDEDHCWEIQRSGAKKLANAGYKQYEVSAYALTGRSANHNSNYWQFGDYLALGAGAHGKITLEKRREILRYQKTRQPENYLKARTTKRFTAQQHTVERTQLAFEFMMNALRLNDGVEASLFEKRTGLPLHRLEATLQSLRRKGLIGQDTATLAATDLGRQYLNTVLEEFIVE